MGKEHDVVNLFHRFIDRFGESVENGEIPAEEFQLMLQFRDALSICFDALIYLSDIDAKFTKFTEIKTDIGVIKLRTFAMKVDKFVSI